MPGGSTYLLFGSLKGGLPGGSSSTLAPIVVKHHRDDDWTLSPPEPDQIGLETVVGTVQASLKSVTRNFPKVSEADGGEKEWRKKGRVGGCETQGIQRSPVVPVRLKPVRPNKGPWFLIDVVCLGCTVFGLPTNPDTTHGTADSDCRETGVRGGCKGGLQSHGVWKGTIRLDPNPYPDTTHGTAIYADQLGWFWGSM